MESAPPITKNVEEKEEKRTKFGTRYLTDPEVVFQHNAWDNVVWDEEQEAMANAIASRHAERAMPSKKGEEYEKDAANYWDQFYSIHQNRFFKDRHWLFTEFPELHGIKTPSEKDTECEQAAKNSDLHSSESQCERESQKRDKDELSGKNCSLPCTNLINTEPTDFLSVNDLKTQLISLGVCDANCPFKIFEVGCGVGNTVFPVLKTNNSPNLMMYCCDFSSAAIDIVKTHPDYDSARCHAFVHDIIEDNPDVPFETGSLDLIIMIFVLSAICPEKMQNAINRLVSYLKPGGALLFRDYGRYDMAQLRFKEGRCITDNFYVRGDGTRVYFFTQDELNNIFVKAGLTKKENMVDRRLQVNRGRQLKMYRVWIQCKYIKPSA